jgi:hypothetical protein
VTPEDAAGLGVRYPTAALARGARHGHVESYFVHLTDPARPRALWIRTTIYVGLRDPEVALAEAWAVAFDRHAGHLAVKTSVPFAKARFAAAAIDAEVDGVCLRADRTHGDVASGGRRVAWDLALTARRGGPIALLPYARLYDDDVPTSKITTPVPDLVARGTVVAGGAKWTVDGWPGLLGHNWGRRHPAAYAWGHASAWVEERDFVLEGVTAALGGHGPRVTLLAARHRGSTFRWNGARAAFANDGTFTQRRWHFAARSREASIEGEMWATTEDFVGLHYENPGGAPLACLHAAPARARVHFAVRGRAPLTLHAPAAALELCTSARDHGVRMYV